MIDFKRKTLINGNYFDTYLYAIPCSSKIADDITADIMYLKDATQTTNYSQNRELLKIRYNIDLANVIAIGNTDEITSGNKSKYVGHAIIKEQEFGLKNIMRTVKKQIWMNFQGNNSIYLPITTVAQIAAIIHDIKMSWKQLMIRLKNPDNIVLVAQDEPDDCDIWMFKSNISNWNFKEVKL